MATTIKPVYYDKFHCIGGDCKHSCCNGWVVVIDKPTYLKYKNIRDRDFQEMLKGTMKRNKTGNPSLGYAYMNLNPDNGNCRFLDEDGMCYIQKKFGESYLSVVCKTYPRDIVIRYDDDSYGYAMSTSCPVIAKEMINENALSFERKEVAKLDVNSTGLIIASPIEKQLVNSACMQFMQCRNLSIANRIMAIGLMLNKLPEKIDDEQLPPTVLRYVESLYAGTYNNLIEGVKRNDDAISVMESSVVQIIMDDKDYDLTAAVIKFLWDSADVGDSKTAEYSDVYKKLYPAISKYWTSFINEKSYILENLLVNYIWRTGFPFSNIKTISMFHHVILLAHQFELFKIYYTVLAQINGGEIDDEKIVEIILAVTRISQHSSAQTRIADTYINKKTATLAHIAFMLMD